MEGSRERTERDFLEYDEYMEYGGGGRSLLDWMLALARRKWTIVAVTFISPSGAFSQAL